MKKVKFRTQYNYRVAPDSFEHLEGKSMTLEDEAFTIRELFERHASGIPDQVHREGYYEENADFDDIDFQKVKDLDPVDRAEIQEELKQKEINDFEQKNAIKKQKAANKKEATKQVQADDELANKKTDSEQTPKEETNKQTIDN